ncbi:bifunctional lysylphosphatidylglycerol flippase/synthetase MprF [Solirhodobacter olei]|uniref:bifunctional lysylphosphatidylglycerol flippase/synthetase MprF n=1 Tax=Solirhodobacter olei TaxID=2493082 RepID=UPI000FD92185|nr:bifunctional lysylphosphatidylglycerol flippase/synthetase MprF [Solirhodobacter olei]
MTEQFSDRDPPRSAWLARLQKAAPFVVGIALFAAGIGALLHLLGPIKLHDVVRDAGRMPIGALIAAFAATAASYTALIGYDWSALRHIGRKLPFPVVGVGAFLGYSLGNTIGISVLSGGAVRYRIYSAFGVNALEVAAISTFVSLAFGVGISVLGLAALAAHPGALTGIFGIAPDRMRIVALIALAATLGVLAMASVAGHAIRIWRFELRAPSPGILLGQLAFTAADTCMAALALYVLLPQGAPDFVTFLAIYTTAAMTGVMSHVPGGIGVFESVVLGALPATVPVEQAAVALLVFRMIYYLTPFALAMIVISVNEARLARGPVSRLLGEFSDTMAPVSRVLTTVAPGATGATVLGLGSYLLALALMPSVRPHEINPHNLIVAMLLEGGAMLSAVLGVILILLAQGLMRRISAAFWLTEIALVAGAVASVLNGLAFVSAGIFLAAAVIFWPLRGEFYRAARLTQNLLSPGWFVLIAAIALAAGAFLFLMQENAPYSKELLLSFSPEANAPRALRAALTASALMVFALIYLALQPARGRSVSADAETIERVEAIVAGQDLPIANLALSGDKTFFFSEAGDAFIMYVVQGKSWIAYGDPVGPKAAVHDLAWAFFDAAYAAGCRPVFYEITDAYLPIWVEMGLTVNKIGEEAIVDLAGFSLSGRKYKAMRAAQNQLEREGVSFALSAPPHSPALMAELADVSARWLAGKKGREKRFSVGRFDPGYLQRFRLALVRREGRVIAFANVLEVPSQAAATVDLMRFAPEAPANVMQYLFVALMERMRAEGVATFSLGMAPLAGLEVKYGARLWNRFGSVLFKYGSAFYNFAGLRAFKQKFGPDWRSRYFAVPGSLPPLTALRDVTRAISGSGRGAPRRGGGADGGGRADGGDGAQSLADHITESG